MLTKLHFLQSKYLLLLIAFIAIIGQPAEAAKVKSCEYRTFNIKIDEKVKGIELLTQIADSCEFSIVIKDAFASTALNKDLFAINMRELSLDEIFELIIMDNNLFYDFNNKFLKISALETKSFKINYITSQRAGTATLEASLEGSGDAGSSSSTNTITSTETFDFWPTLVAEITAVLNTGADEYVAQPPFINQNAGLITVTATKKQLDRISDYIDTLEDRLHKQVLIDVSILSVGLSEGSQTGINWSKFELSINGGGAPSVGITDTKDIISSVGSTTSSTVSIANSLAFSMVGLIDFLGTNGDAKVISSPKVLTLNNQQALITIGDNINYRIPTESNDADTNNVTVTYENNSIFVGVLLNITPEITDDGEIILRINPSVSGFKYAADEVQQDRLIAPDTSEKKLSTVVKVKNNNTIILGGLITRTDSDQSSSVPILGDIPILGNAFKHSEKASTVQELVFVITPRIIGARDNTKATLKDLGFSKRVYEQ